MIINGRALQLFKGGKIYVQCAKVEFVLARAVFVGLSILVLVPGVSIAKNKGPKEKDYCISFPGHAGFALVGQEFVIPDAGKCIPWTGFFVPNKNSPSAGTACTATDGSDMSITITSSTPGNPVLVFIDSVTLSLPAQTGTDVETGIGTTTTFLTLAVTGARCTNVAIPAAATAPAASAGTAQPGSP
jgi:hypothetical protein